MTDVFLDRAAATAYDARIVAEELTISLREQGAHSAASYVSLLATALVAIDRDIDRHVEHETPKENPPR